jgi:hypothetical protein
LKQVNNQYNNYQMIRNNHILLYFCFIVLVSINVKAQSDNIQLGSRQYGILDRLEIQMQTDSVLNFSAVKPYNRQTIAQRLEYIKQLADQGKINLSTVDQYNLNLLLLDNFDQRSNLQDTTLNFKTFFSAKSKSNPAYLGVKRGDFSLFITPVFNIQVGKDNNLSKSLVNGSRGFYTRGQLTKNIGYYTYFTTNQERDPLYVQQYEQAHNALPGAGFYRLGFSAGTNNGGYDYYDARGGINFKIAKGIQGEFAYDKVFIGNGVRSLILSDFSNNFLFFKINTRIWKFNYYNLFAQLVENSTLNGANFLLPKKYMALHYLDFQATKKFNLGFFEDIMFGRSNGFDLSYLNPIIFYRSAELENGSPDKVTLGLNLKYNAFKNTQLYGQLILNEFVFNDLIHYSTGSRSNKEALQLGLKRIDVFGIKNLDIQGEINIIRPFVYQHYDSVGSFTHYNQPLAHPAGANLRELIAIVKYQPIPKLTLQGKLIYYEQGLDSAGLNFGANPFSFYNTAPRYYGFYIGSGILAKTMLVNVSAAYEILPNIFLDANASMRTFKRADTPTTFKSNFFTVGIRMNMQKRSFDF